jgi:predicted transcriptional regulator
VKPAAPEPDTSLVITEKTLPHSSKIVLEVLVSGNTMTHKDLVQRTRLAPKTVRYGLKRLVERHLIIRKLNFRDGRQIIYQTSPVQRAEPVPAN